MRAKTVLAFEDCALSASIAVRILESASLCPLRAGAAFPFFPNLTMKREEIQLMATLCREDAEALLVALDQWLEALQRTECADREALWSETIQKEKGGLISVTTALQAALRMKLPAAH
jgi:hypothetical protein